jgi:hypothetical protein
MVFRSGGFDNHLTIRIINDIKCLSDSVCMTLYASVSQTAPYSLWALAKNSAIHRE